MTFGHLPARNACSNLQIELERSSTYQCAATIIAGQAMNKVQLGIALTLLVVLVEAVQFVYLGGLFQRMSSFQFGFLVFSLTSVLAISYLAIFDRNQISNALADPGALLAINLAAVVTFLAFLLSVQLIEPVITYTISAGVMPITTYCLYRLGWQEGDPFRNYGELAGTILILASIVFLAVITFFGLSGFVRGDEMAGLAGIVLAVFDGVFFTFILVYSKRMNDNGAGPNAVLGFRILLYILVAGGLTYAGFDAREPLGTQEIAFYVGAGFLLIVPPLYVLQKAISLVSTLTISALTTLGPIFIFALQLVEGRVEFSFYTLVGLGIYFAGALLAALSPARAQTESENRS